MQYLGVCHLQRNNKRRMLYRKERKKERKELLFLPHLLLLRLLILPLGSLFQRSSFSRHHDARSAQPAANDHDTLLLTRESE